MEFDIQKDAEELGYTCEKQVCFSNRNVEGFSVLKTKDRVERANSAFDGGTFGIQVVYINMVFHIIALKR